MTSNLRTKKSEREYTAIHTSIQQEKTLQSPDSWHRGSSALANHKVQRIRSIRIARDGPKDRKERKSKGKGPEKKENRDNNRASESSSVTNANCYHDFPPKQKHCQCQCQCIPGRLLIHRASVASPSRPLPRHRRRSRALFRTNRHHYRRRNCLTCLNEPPLMVRSSFNLLRLTRSHRRHQGHSSSSSNQSRRD